MNLTPHSVSKFLEAEIVASNIEDEEARRPGDAIGGSAATKYGSRTVFEDVTGTFLSVFVFTEDILPEILDNIGILKGKDLLNFRLINRCWRDAATSVLLKRSMCQVALDFGKMASAKVTSVAVAQAELDRSNDCSTDPPSYNYFNIHHPKSVLSDLSTLISTSPEFPSNSIRFHAGCSLGFGNLLLVSDADFDIGNQNQNDLFHFLSLYGKNVKKLSLCNGISKNAVQNLLYVHMPHLSCLDLQYFHEFKIQGQMQENIEIHVCPSILEMNEIVLGHETELSDDKSNFVRELISVSPNLSEIHNVSVSAIRVLLEMEKCHLIKDLHFNPTPHQLPIVRQFTEFLTNKNLISDLRKLKLNQLVVRLRGQIRVTLLNYLETILCASRYSLKYLKLHRGSDIAVLPDMCNTLQTVNTLELNGIPLNDRLWSKCFPNITRLKVRCKLSDNLENRNWIWTAFPKLKQFEIFGLKIVGYTTVIDTFFTGVPYGLCTQLQSGDATFPELLGSSAGTVDVFERTQPYIGDCKNLQEFKISFESKLYWEFASNVTAVYGFHEIFYRTKIIFSFESIELSAKDIQETHKYLDPVAAYVKIQMRK